MPDDFLNFVRFCVDGLIDDAQIVLTNESSDIAQISVDGLVEAVGPRTERKGNKKEEFDESAKTLEITLRIGH